MIAILSNESDHSTDVVVEWIRYLCCNCNILRLNSEKDYSLLFIKNDIIIKHNTGINYSFSSINSVWYRRGFFKYNIDKTYFEDIKSKEVTAIEEYINYKLSSKKSINTYKNIEINKLTTLLLAKELGIKTPKFYLIEQKKDLEKIVNKKSIITKNFLESSFFLFSDTEATIFTNDVKKGEKIQENFSPSLFQEKIEKKYELRIFFFRDKFWAMAVLSQQDEQTKTDFRNYNKGFPNRTVPYKLPKSKEEKLLKLMKKLDLNCASIDAIITPKNKFVFLEVNPVGQFSMVSIPCNYYLERELATYLTY